MFNVFLKQMRWKAFFLMTIPIFSLLHLWSKWSFGIDNLLLLTNFHDLQNKTFSLLIYHLFPYFLCLYHITSATYLERSYSSLLLIRVGKKQLYFYRWLIFILAFTILFWLVYLTIFGFLNSFQDLSLELFINVLLNRFSRSIFLILFYQKIEDLFNYQQIAFVLSLLMAVLLVLLSLI